MLRMHHRNAISQVSMACGFPGGIPIYGDFLGTLEIIFLFCPRRWNNKLNGALQKERRAGTPVL
jgi:hypothetical protein